MNKKLITGIFVFVLISACFANEDLKENVEPVVDDSED